MGGSSNPLDYILAISHFTDNEYDKGTAIGLTLTAGISLEPYEIKPTSLKIYIKNTYFKLQSSEQYIDFEGWYSFSLSSSMFAELTTFTFELPWTIQLYNSDFTRKGRFAFNVGRYELQEAILEGELYYNGQYSDTFEMDCTIPISGEEVKIIQGDIRQCFVYNLYDTRWKDNFDDPPAHFFDDVSSAFENQFSLSFSVYDEAWNTDLSSSDNHITWTDQGRLQASENLGISNTKGWAGNRTTSSAKLFKENHGFDMLGVYPGVIGEHIGWAFGTIFTVFKGKEVPLIDEGNFKKKWMDNVIIHEISRNFRAKDHNSWDTVVIANFESDDPDDWVILDWGDVSVMTYPEGKGWEKDGALFCIQIAAFKAWVQRYNWLPEDIGDGTDGRMKDAINNLWWNS